MKTFLNILLVLLTSTILSSCKVNEGQSPSSDTPGTTTPSTPSTPSAQPLTGTKEEQMTNLTNQFKADYSASWTTITLGFKPSSYMNGGSGGSTTVVGVCEVYSDGSKKVWMNQDWWEQSSTSDLAKKVLFYHEMGHCYFNRSHDTRTYAGGRPYSMMYPVLDPVVAFYNSYTSYYISELANSSLGGTMVAFSKTTNSEEVTLVYSSQTDETGVCVE